MASSELNLSLKARLADRSALIVPGASSAMSARIIEDLGFEAVYLSGAGITNSFSGMPDLGFIGLSDVVQHTLAVRQAVNLPIIVDADTGFGNAVNAHHSVRMLEQAGANGIQIEDQVMPKRCGHFSGKDVVPAKEAVERIRAAVEAKRDSAFQIIARTDARVGYGLEHALERAELFVGAGADVIFIEAPESIAEIRTMMERLPVPQVLNLVLGGRTPIVSREEAKAMRCAMLLYANAALQAAIAGMQGVLSQLKAQGRLEEDATGVASFSARQQVVRKTFYDNLEKRHAT